MVSPGRWRRQGSTRYFCMVSGTEEDRRRGEVVRFFKSGTWWTQPVTAFLADWEPDDVNLVDDVNLAD